MNIGENIKKLRKEKKITQKEISNKLNINIRTYQKYESGEINPSIETINKISKILEVPLTLFINHEERDLYKDLITEAYTRECDDITSTTSKIANEMNNRELVINLAYADLISQLDAEKNIINYIISKLDDEELSNIELTQSENMKLFDFILIASNVKIKELIKKRKYDGKKEGEEHGK